MVGQVFENLPAQPLDIHVLALAISRGARADTALQVLIPRGKSVPRKDSRIPVIRGRPSLRLRGSPRALYDRSNAVGESVNSSRCVADTTVRARLDREAIMPPAAPTSRTYIQPSLKSNKCELKSELMKF